MKNKEYKVLDLFCGCGGLSLGFEQAGYNVLLGIDNWEDALVTFRNNHHGSDTICADLMKLNPEDVEKKIGKQKLDVIVGGPPCQGFSIAGKRIVEDDRDKLYKSFVNMVSYFQPKAFVLENVPNILTMGDGAIKKAIISDFENISEFVQDDVNGYKVAPNSVNAIIEKIVLIKNDNALKDKLGYNNYLKTVENHSQEKSCETIKSIIEE